MNAGRVLVVDDDGAMRAAVCDTLLLAGLATVDCADGETALAALERRADIDLVLSDLNMAPMDGLELLSRLRARRPELPVVLMSAYGTIARAVEALRHGASDFIEKPFEPAQLLEKLRLLLPAEAERPGAEVQAVAVDPRSRELWALAERVAGTEATVLISGESGTGKEVLARHLHRRSNRAAGPFVAINCAAIPENMLEAVLFGYEKGAFTGAARSLPGKFEQAQGGTLLLDEISEMDLALQAKLLRVLQEREVERLGGRRLVQLDVRVLATTNRNLREEVGAGRFREDLFYRLNVFPLHMPSLRERPGDIAPLAEALLSRHAGAGSATAIEAAALERLRAHPWPGNVRELENVLQRAQILARGAAIAAPDLVFEDPAAGPAAAAPGPVAAAPGAALETDLKHREQAVILEALQASNGSRKEAASRLGISPRTLRYKLSRLRDAGVAIPGGFGV